MTAQSVVVTGAGRGIGRALALRLGRLGYAVAIQGRSLEPLRDLEAELKALGAKVAVVPGDVTDPQAAQRLIQAAEAIAPVFVAVACAGQAASAKLQDTTADQLRQLLEVNVVSALHLLQAAQAVMVPRKQGRLVVVASTAAIKGFRYTAAYSASKHAVLGLVRSAALELAPHGITVNALCPGWVDTPMFEQTIHNIMQKTGASEKEARGQIEKMIPLRQVLSVEDVAGQLAYVVSKDAAKLTGQALVLDGGETL